MHRIVLSGIKHSGKSTIGWDLASRMGLYFADLDDLILRDNPNFDSIRSLYRDLGQQGFQNKESESLGHFFNVNKKSGFVLSLGGGSIENEQAVRILAKQQCSTVFLDADAQVLFERIIRGGLPPFLEGKNPMGKFMEMYNRRTARYKDWAQFCIDTRDLTPSVIAAIIEEKLQR